MNKHPVSWWCCQANFWHGISCYFEANSKIIFLCYFFLKLFVCAISYVFFNYGLMGVNIQTTIWFELFIFFLSRLKSLPFPFLKFADLPILRPFVREKCLSCWTPFQNPLPCQFSLRKKLRFPGKSFSILVFPPHFWRSIHFPRKMYCCSVFIYFVFLLNTWSVQGKVFPLSFVCLCWASENFSVSATLSELSDGCLSPSVKFHCGKHFWLDGSYRKCISV